MRGRVVVVTGASSGFGRGIALKFAAAGASVVVAARRGDALKELVDEIKVSGGTALAVTADVSKRPDVENLARQARSEYGPVNIWINNAGVGAVGRFADVPIEDHEQVIRTNLLGVIYGCHAVWREFLKKKKGTLVNLGSELGKMPAPLYASYTASKHGVVALGQALRQELREVKNHDIHVCTIMPAATDTFFFDHAANYTGHETVPIKPLYDAQTVIDKVFEMAFSPQDEVFMTGKSKITNVLHKLMPRATQAMAEKQIRKEQLEEAPMAPNTGGSVRKPSSYGTKVSPHRLRK